MLKGQVRCAGCGVWHFPALARKHVNCEPVDAVVVNAVNTVVHAEPSAVNKSKRGAYPNTDARREYMREKMRARRAERATS